MTEQEAAVRTLLQSIGEDPDRQGLVDTPRRVVKALKEMCEGLSFSDDYLPTIFASQFDSAVEELIVVRDLKVSSLCEHHLLPFYGHCHIGYLPRAKVLGLSKFSRVVHYYAARPQIQENLTRQICDAVYKNLGCRAVIVVVRAVHMCMVARGVKEHAPITVTSAIAGEVHENPSLKSEFYHLLGDI